MIEQATTSNFNAKFISAVPQVAVVKIDVEAERISQQVVL
jgi:hypothetical protein